MNSIEIFRQAIDSFRSSRLRSSLTLLAISVGVFAIISAHTAVLVLDNYFRDTLSSMGGDVIEVRKFPVSISGVEWSLYRNRPDITLNQMERLAERLPLSAEVGPNRTWSTTRVTAGERETEPNVGIRGANEFYLNSNSFNLAAGRNFIPEDLDHARRVAILGSEVAENLFGWENPVGREIRIGGLIYRVIGVTEEKGALFGNSQDRFVLVPYPTLGLVYGRSGNTTIQLRAGDVNRLESVMDEVAGILRALRRVAPEDPDDFELVTNEAVSSSLAGFTGVLYMIGFLVGGIVLLGAGIGVMNIMLVSVTERTREIGLRKAVGATRRTIVLQFLLESVVICQIGGVIGWGMGAGLGNAAALWLGSGFVFPWQAAAAGVIGMTLVGVIFGVYPAFRAARLDPVESLRYE